MPEIKAKFSQKKKKKKEDRNLTSDDRTARPARR